MMIQFPHCDARILHAPGECEFCDSRQEWQELRRAWHVAYTGHAPEANELPCPADLARPPGSSAEYSELLRQRHREWLAWIFGRRAD